MKLLIFGPTGGTGQELVKQALEQGHKVTAFARRPAKLKIEHPSLAVVKGDVVNSAAVDEAVKGCDAVLSALGTKQLTKNAILSGGTRNIISSMQRHGVRRFICESSLGVGDSLGQTPWYFKYIARPLLLRNVFADKEIQEQLIGESGLDWVIVRPAILTNGPRTSSYRHGFSVTDKTIKNRISRADVAGFMLEQATGDAYLRQTVGVSY
jgi:putative NADH-flavin reductase